MSACEVQVLVRISKPQGKGNLLFFIGGGDAGCHLKKLRYRLQGVCLITHILTISTKQAVT